MNTFHEILNQINGLVWGLPLLILLVGTGVYFTIRLQIQRHLFYALKLVFSKPQKDAKAGDISSFAALCVALSATIGTGNIVGVATAIAIGGPGALFWMWVAAFVGMATKYSECLLAVKYRRKDSKGQMVGGPMYYLEHGAGSKFLAKMFAVFAILVACLGIGTFAQVNAIVDASALAFDTPKILTAAALTLLVAVITLGGVQSIAKVVQKIVPSMALLYIVTCFCLLILNYDKIGAAFELIIHSAFNPTAASGGFLGATMMLALKSGIARGVFSNEAGLGSAPIAAAAAQTNSSARQGLIAMTGTFFDTLVICTMTGLTLVITQVWQGDAQGAAMTTAGFAQGLNAPFLGPLIVSIGLIFFAFTTILGWNYYGERCMVYLFDNKAYGKTAIYSYKIIFICLVAIGAFLKLELIWTLADIVNGLMAVPNLIGLVLLRREIILETQNYFQELKQKKLANA